MPEEGAEDDGDTHDDGGSKKKFIRKTKSSKSQLEGRSSSVESSEGGLEQGRKVGYLRPRGEAGSHLGRGLVFPLAEGPWQGLVL